ARETASSTSRVIASALRSDVEAAATDLPTKPRSAMWWSRACLTVSTCPRRTWAEKALFCTTNASAAVAPLRVACARRSARRSRMRSDLRPADRHAVDADGRQSHADRDGLAVFAAGAHALVELEVVADAAHAGERFRSVADQGRALDRAGDAAVLDQVGLARREHEAAVGD